MNVSKLFSFRRNAVLLFSAIVLVGSPPANGDTPEVLPGDLIFQESTTPQPRAIKEVTGSRYSHCGIVVKRDGKLFVAEAIEPVRVVDTPNRKLRSIEKWIGAGVDKHAVIKRIRGRLTPERLGKLEESMLRFQGKPYDKLFQWSDDKIYCSEFIYDSFNDPNLEEKQRIVIGEVQTFSKLNLEGELAKALIKERYTREGKVINQAEEIITPVAVLNDSNLDTVAVVEKGKVRAPTPAPQ